MKISSYTMQQLENDMKEFLFQKWLDSNLDDHTDWEMRDAHMLWHEPLYRQYRGENE